MPVITGAVEYPQELVKKMQDKGINIDAFDALTLAEEAGSSKAVNMVLMGKVSNYFDFSEDTWQEAITHSVKEKFIEMNKKAFHLGRNA